MLILRTVQRQKQNTAASTSSRTIKDLNTADDDDNNENAYFYHDEENDDENNEDNESYNDENDECTNLLEVLLKEDYIGNDK